MTIQVTDRAAAIIKSWRGNTPKLARECFHFAPDEWQDDVFRAFDADVPVERIAMQACAGPGKSAVMAILGYATLITRADRGKHPNGYALSITADNLRDNLWKEMAFWRNRSPFVQEVFEFTAEKIFAKDHPDTWWLKARSFAKTADPETQGVALSGLHAPFIFYLLDETGTMNASLLNKAEQGVGNCEWGRIVIAGNPNSINGALYHAVANQASRWRTFRVTADPDDPKRTPRVSADWARAQIAEHGRDNAWVKVFILGEFPPGGMNSLVGPDEVRTAMERNPTPDSYEWAQKRLGVDVARFGDDRTVIYPRQGICAFQPIILRHQDTNFIAAKVMRIVAEWGAELVLIDDTGHWGHGVFDNLNAAGVASVPVNFSDKKTFDPRYFNRRSEILIECANWVKSRGALPNSPGLLQEMVAHTYYFQDGKERVTEKDQVKETLGRSPDEFDALALTFAIPDQPGGFTIDEALAQGVVKGFDAFHRRHRTRQSVVTDDDVWSTN